LPENGKLFYIWYKIFFKKIHKAIDFKKKQCIIVFVKSFLFGGAFVVF